MKFSIVTCTWNSAAFLPQSIRSVQGQNYTDIEYIFVDGGSTDGTIDMIESIPRQIKLIRNIKGGIARAMNVGIEAASGDIVAHLHSDDYYAHQNVLSKVAKVFNDTNASWLYGRCLADIGGRLTHENYKIPSYSYRRLRKRNIIPHPATFVKRQFLNDVGCFDEHIKYAMDYDLWLRLGKKASPIQLNEPLAVFRWHEGSATSSNRMASLKDDFSVRLRHIRKTPWSLAYHWIHYLYRCKRLARQLASEGA